ncbi:MAG TPA: efflux RND transporter periplasmic adaptor subunit [Gemmataceae bacterium]|jgi:RND family efflux transporter MFP subunit
MVPNRSIDSFGRIGWVALLPLLAALGCGHGSAKLPRQELERLPRLEVTRPVRTNLFRRVELAATVEPMKKVDLCARVPGVVGYMPDKVDIGLPVRTGEVLARLDVPDLEAEKRHKETLLEQARKQKTQAEEAKAVAEREVEESKKIEKRWAADYTFQKLKFERQRDLVRRGAADLQLQQEAQRQMESAEAAWEAAQTQILTRQAKARAALADLSVAENRIQVADAEVKKVEALLKLATIHAPFDGVLTRRWVDRGAMIKDPGAPLLTLMQTDRVRVLVDVPQRDVSLLNTREQNPNKNGNGDPVRVHIPTLAHKVPKGEFEGYVTRKSGLLDPVTRTMRTEIEIANPDKHLEPGMYGTALLLLEEHYNVLTLPASTLVRRGEGKVEVYHIAEIQGEPPTGVLLRKEVELGLDNGQVVEILRGLTGNESVVLRGNGVMRDEDRVIAVPERRPQR